MVVQISTACSINVRGVQNKFKKIAKRETSVKKSFFSSSIAKRETSVKKSFPSLSIFQNAKRMVKSSHIDLST